MRFVGLLLLAILLYVGFTMPKPQRQYRSRGSELVHEVLEKAARKIHKKYGLNPIGTGISMPGGPIRTIGLDFEVKGPLTRDQLRKLLFETAHMLLEEVERNEEIQQYLKDGPFTIRNVTVIIYNHDKKGRKSFDPEISNGSISQMELKYSSIDPDNEFEYKNEFEETYEEAIEILRQQKNEPVR